MDMVDNTTNPPGMNSASPEDSGMSYTTQVLLKVGAIAPPGRPGLIGQLDKYEIIRELGAGGMGVVYLARDVPSNDLVAIKMIKPGMEESEGVSNGFSKELKALEMLKDINPHLMPVLAVSLQPHAPYYVMP